MYVRERQYIQFTLIKYIFFGVLGQLLGTLSAHTIFIGIEVIFGVYMFHDRSSSRTDII